MHNIIRNNRANLKFKYFLDFQIKELQHTMRIALYVAEIALCAAKIE